MSTTHSTTDEHPEVDDLDAVGDLIADYLEDDGQKQEPPPMRQNPHTEAVSIRTVHDWPAAVAGPMLVDRLGIEQFRAMSPDARIRALHDLVEAIVRRAATRPEHAEAIALMADQPTAAAPSILDDVPALNYSGATEVDPTKVDPAFNAS